MIRILLERALSTEETVGLMARGCLIAHTVKVAHPGIRNSRKEALAPQSGRAVGGCGHRLIMSRRRP